MNIKISIIALIIGLILGLFLPMSFFCVALFAVGFSFFIVCVYSDTFFNKFGDISVCIAYLLWVGMIVSSVKEIIKLTTMVF